MTSTSNLADVVRHYQRSIERHGDDETRLLHCITKLFNLPITFEHLQETGIGKTVNALRKINGEVGVAAKTLVTKWKAMVAAAEEPVTQNNSNEEDSNRSNGRRSSEEDPDQENKGSNSSSGEDPRHRHKSKHEERSKSDHSDHKSKSSSNHSNGSSHKSHSKSRSDSEKKHKSSSHEKSKAKDSDSDRHRKEQKTESSSEHRKQKESVAKSSSSTSTSSNHHKSTSENNHHSSSKHRHHSSHKGEHSSKSKQEKNKEEKSHSSEEKAAKEKTDKHKSSSSSSKSSKRGRSPQRSQDDDSPKTKMPKTKPKADAVEQKETADEFDSSMGANFDDVLGMLNMPMSGKKMSTKVKSPNKPTTATTTGSSSSSSSSKRTTATTSTTAATAASTSSTSSSRSTSTKKPELLAPSAKLEPLDPSIALELPTISNNYKPMPLNQTVMDVVFNHGLGNNAPKAPRNFNESEALAAGISSKTMRTKIYSGVRTGQILQVPSLFDLCTRVLQKNIDALEYTGGVPFDVLRPVLERATPHQLLNFEEYNPYLMEDSDVLWQQHVQRHCRSQRREEMETWREMFLRCEEEKERKLSTIAESIKASQKISEAPIRKTQLAFVDSMVKPPRNVQRKQEQYGTKGKLIATPAARVAALSSVTPNAAKVGDARLRVLSAARDAAQVSAPVRNKKAPLMAKALQLIRGRHKR